MAKLVDPQISVVIPVYNEAETIGEIIRRLRAVTGTNFELVVVDDGSTDGTAQVLEDLCGQIDQVLVHETNRGKGAALRTGFQAVTGDITVVQDSDLEYDPREIARLAQPIADDLADVVYGSRFKGNDSHRVLYFWHSVGNAFLTLLSNAFTNLNLSDMETGYKAFRAAVAKQLPLTENGFGVEPEITAKVAKAGLRIYEVGISYHGRTYEEGKKIDFRDGFWAICCILRYNLFS